MLGDGIGVALAIPFFGEEMPETDANHAMFRRQRADHAAPDAKIVERAMHADKRRTLPHVQIGHVKSVDVKRLHGSSLQGMEEPLCKIPGLRVDRNYFQA